MRNRFFLFIIICPYYLGNHTQLTRLSLFFYKPTDPVVIKVLRLNELEVCEKTKAC